MDNILHMIGMANRAGKLEAGEEPVGAACRARTCRLLLVACDAADNTLRRVHHFAEAGQCLWRYDPIPSPGRGYRPVFYVIANQCA